MRGGLLCAMVFALVAACGSQGNHGGPADGSLDGPIDASPDAADAPPSTVAAPRLIAPLSVTAVTQQRPTLRWVLTDGGGTPTVEVCKDRECKQPIPVAMQLAGDHRSATPLGVLPHGWVFWRVRVVLGSQVARSGTWQFWVGRSSASSPVDTSNGAPLDINGDSYPDFVVGAPDSNSVHVYLGSASASATDWNGASPLARIDLVTFDGLGSGFGISVANVGDINGDGYADFMVGSPGALSVGIAHLYLGSATPRDEDWNGVIARNRIDLTTPALQGFAGRVAGAGDVDGDGFADFLVTGWDGYHSEAVVWLYLGAATPTGDDWNKPVSPQRIELTAPADHFGFTRFGTGVAGVGDLNGDGYADFAIGDFELNRTYVYLGSSVISEATWNGASAAHRRDLTSPDATSSNFGISVASAGDVNGDGYADFLVGNAPNSGLPAVRLYLGSSTISAASWNQSSSARRVDLTCPDGPNDWFGRTLAAAGDINGDGYADFLVGAEVAAAARGSAHLYLGSAAASAGDWNGASPGRRIDLTGPDGTGGHFGSAMANVGDVNGDGYADFLVGADGSTLGSVAPGWAHLYLGAAAIDVTHWNEASSASRLDLTGPDGPGARFGNAVD